MIGSQCASKAFQGDFNLYLPILEDILFVLTDTEHKSGFKLQSILIARMFALMGNNVIKIPLYATDRVPLDTPKLSFP